MPSPSAIAASRGWGPSAATARTKSPSGAVGGALKNSHSAPAIAATASSASRASRSAAASGRRRRRPARRRRRARRRPRRRTAEADAPSQPTRGDAGSGEDGDPPRRSRRAIHGCAKRQRDQRQRRIGLIKPTFALDEERRQPAERGERRRRDQRRAQPRPGDQRERHRQRRPRDDRRVDDQVAHRLAHRQIGGGDRRQNVADIGGKSPGHDARIGERDGSSQPVLAGAASTAPRPRRAAR